MPVSPPADEASRRIFGKAQMKIKLSDHAKRQRIERQIPLNQILQTIKNPQNKDVSFKNRQLLQRKFSGKILEVVTVEEEDSTIVITQYYLEGDQS